MPTRAASGRRGAACSRARWCHGETAASGTPLPKPLRLRLARHPAWTTWVGGLIVRAIAAWQRRVARARHLAAPQTGAITFVQRFGGLVNLNVHFHLLVPDGVFTPTADDGLAFALLPAPTGTDLLAILDRVIRRIARRIADESGDYDAAGDLDPCPDLLAQIQAEAVTTWRSPATATSDVVRGTDRLRAWSGGFSLHAGVVIADHDREALERLARYGARPAFAHDRLTWTSDGRISYKLKRPWPDGRTHLVSEPVAFLRRLIGIIPPPRRHLVRYAGVFGPAIKARPKLRALVPATAPDNATHPGCPAATPPTPADAPHPGGSPAVSRPRRLPWAELLRRVFAQGVLQCACGGRRTVVAFVADANLTRSLLTSLGLPAEPATFAPARAPPQAELAWHDPA